jgi:WD40 repeat protein
LAVVAVDDPDTPGFTEALEQQLQVIRTWWAPRGEAHGGFTEIALHGARERHDIERFLHARQLRETPEDVPLVLYVTSHGVLARSQRHFLRFPGSDDGRLPATGMPTNDLVVAALSSRARHVLVIVNACHAGAVGDDLSSWLADLDDPGRRLSVIVATDTTSQVQVLEFATVLRRAYEQLERTAQITRPYLSVGEFLHALQEATTALNAERGYTDPYGQLPGPRELTPNGHLAQEVYTLPNPGYRPDGDLVPAERREVSTSIDELEAWLRQAKRDTSGGWYVTGRRRLNEQIADFLYRPFGILIVAGAATTGKSSLLARAVSLSERALRQVGGVAAVLGDPAPATVPPPGSVDVAVSARNRTSASVLEAIGTRLPGFRAAAPPDGTDAVHYWQRHLATVMDARPHQSLTVVIDALDEACDPLACIRDVLQPLAALNVHTGAAGDRIPVQSGPNTPLPPRRLKLIVAVRSSLAPAPHDLVNAGPTDLLGELIQALPQAHTARTDGADISSDINNFVLAELRGPAWDLVPQVRVQAARDVAAHVGHSFLDARLAVEHLAEQGPRLLNDQVWLDRLQHGTPGLLEQDLQAVTDDDLTPEIALTLLRATAFAFGAGLPWAGIWPAVAQALSPFHLHNVDSSIQRLLKGGLAGYLSQDIEDDRRVYRPAHDRLSQLLRRWPIEGGVALSHSEPGALPDPYDRQTHQRITDALAQLVHADPIGQPHPYLARYLPHHAAAAQLLDDEHLPPALLPWVSGDTVRGLLDASDDPRASRTWLITWAAIEPFIQHADLPSRCSSLQLAHTALHHPGVPTNAQDLDGSRIRVRWARWQPPANVLATTRQPCRTVATLTHGGRSLIALGSESGCLDLIDARTGGVLGDRIAAHAGAVRRLHIRQDGARTLLISASTDGFVRILDVNDRRLIDQFGGRGRTWAADLTTYRSTDGSLIVIAVNGDGEVTEWRENHGERQLARMSAHPEEPHAFALLAATTGEGRRVLVCAGKTLRIWGAEGLVAEHSLPAAVRVLASHPSPGLIVAGHHDGTVTLWDLDTGSYDQIHATDASVTTLVCLSSGDRYLAAVANGTRIDLWDLTTHLWAGRLTGHTGTITALHTDPHSPHLLVSCARDNTIRTWTDDAVRSALDGAVCPPAVLGGACRYTDTGQEVAVSYAADGLQIWDPHTGNRGPALPSRDGQPVAALAYATSGDGQPLLLYTAADYAIGIWHPHDPQSDEPAALTGHVLDVRCLATCTTADGQMLALSGGDDHTVRLWDLSTRRQMAIWKHDFAVLTVAAALHHSGTPYLVSGSADGTARLWYPGSPTALHTFPCHQGRINALALDPHTPDGFLLATAGDDTVRLWNLDTYAPRGAHLRGHTNTIEALTAWTTPHPTPRSYVASASRDGTLRLWDTATGRCILQLATGTHVHTLTARPHSAEPAVTLTITGAAGTAVVDVRLDG